MLIRIFEDAFDMCLKEEMGYKLASETFGVNISSLRRRVNNKNKNAVGAKKSLGSKSQSLPKPIERALHEYIIEMDRFMFGLTTFEVRKMAYELALKNNISFYPNQLIKLSMSFCPNFFAIQNFHNFFSTPIISIKL